MKTTPENLKALFNKAFKEAESGNFWTPKKEGERIGGKIIKIEKGKPSKTVKKPSRIITLENIYTGKVISFFEKHVIAERFKELGVKLGDVVAIEYGGAKMKGNRVEYHKFHVVKV